MSGWDFNSIVNRLRPVRVLPDEPDIPDPEGDLACNLGPWASEDPCSEWFLPWLSERIELLDQEEATSVRSHPDLLLAKGRRMEAKHLRDQFYKWRGQGPKAPAA